MNFQFWEFIGTRWNSHFCTIIYFPVKKGESVNGMKIQQEMTSIWYIKVLHTLPGRARHQQWGRRGNRSSENNRSKNRHVNLRFHSSSCELEVNRENGTKRDIQAKRLQLLRGYEHMKEVSIIKKNLSDFTDITLGQNSIYAYWFLLIYSLKIQKRELKFEA